MLPVEVSPVSGDVAAFCVGAPAVLLAFIFSRLSMDVSSALWWAVAFKRGCRPTLPTPCMSVRFGYRVPALLGRTFHEARGGE
jgi:hypothetical protein